METEQDDIPNVEVDELIKERDTLISNEGCENAIRLLNQEIERLQNGGTPTENNETDSKSDIATEFLEVYKPKPIRLQIKVAVPVNEHPKFNFVGKLLGPKGLSLKRLQDESMTKMAILGKGSMRDKAKEAEYRASNNPKYAHLNKDLHVEVNAYAPAGEAYARVAHAIQGIKKFLVPDYYDDIRSQQFHEMAVMNGMEGKPPRGGMSGGPMMKSLAPPPIGGRTPKQDHSQWVALGSNPPQRTSTPRGRGRGRPGPFPGPGRGGVRGGRGGMNKPRPQDFGFEQDGAGYMGDNQGYEDNSYANNMQNAEGDGNFYDYSQDDNFQNVGGDYDQGYMEDWGAAKSSAGPVRRGGMSRGSFRNQPYANRY